MNIEIPITIVLRVKLEQLDAALQLAHTKLHEPIPKVIDCSPGTKPHGIGKGPKQETVFCKGCKREYQFTCALRSGLCRKCGNWGKRPGTPGNKVQRDPGAKADREILNTTFPSSYNEPAKPLPNTIASLLEALRGQYKKHKTFCTGDAMALEDLTLDEANSRLRKLQKLGAVELKEEMHSHLTEWFVK